MFEANYVYKIFSIMPNKVNRNSMFYQGEEEFQFETDLIMQYIEEDVNQVVILYEVDRTRTNIDANYKETDAANNIRFKPPKEVPCLYEVSDSTMNSYDGIRSNAVYSLSGNLTCYIPLASFEKYKFDIKRGDYLAVHIDTDRMIYFTVTDDGKMNTANRNIVGAYKTAFRTVKATPAPNEFFGK